MIRKPLISIIMPVYNSSETLSAAVTSVIEQDCDDWELLVIDDGSTEDITPLIDAFGDDRIRLLRLSKNGGLAAALNVGLAEATAPYLARIDADDAMESWRLTEQLRHLTAEKLAVCGTGARKFGVEGGLIIPPASGEEVIDSFFSGNPFVHPTILFDRELAGPDLRYDAGFQCEEDYELWSRLVTRKNCGNLQAPAIRYRVGLANNANHPAKRILNRRALVQFAMRMGAIAHAPISALNEFQMTGFVDEPNYRQMLAYAEQSDRAGWPRLGSLHASLLTARDYTAFLEELMDQQRISVRMVTIAAQHPW